MKTRFLLLVIVLLFGYGSQAQTTIRISTFANDTVCSGTSVSFTSTVTPTGSYGYNWKVNGVSAGASVDTFTFITNATGRDTINCILTNVAGSSVLALSDTVIIVVDSVPVIAPITGRDSICVGSSSQLSDADHGGIWSSTNVVAATISSTGLVTALSVPVGMMILTFTLPPAPVYATYYLTNGCGTDSIQQQIYISARPSPISVPASSVCIGDTLTLTDSANGGLWTTNDSAIASFPTGFLATFLNETSDLIGNSAGTVTVYFTDTSGCGVFTDSASINVIDCAAGVPKVTSLAQGCSIYPNPAAGEFNVTVRSEKYSEVNCVVYDMMGEKVKDIMINTNEETPVQLSVPTGIYFIAVSAGNEKYTSKLVIIQ